MTSTKVLILDNGAYTIKAGYSGDDWDNPRYVRARHIIPQRSCSRIFPNSIARSKVEKKIFVGDEIESCRDYSGVAYRRPFEKVSCTLP